MKIHSTKLLFFLGVLASSASADTFVMRDGTELVGKIISQDEKSYLLEVQVTKSIKDERRVAKADVRRIEAEDVELTAYEAVLHLKQIPDMLSSAEYAARIKTLEKFLAEYKTGSRSMVVRKILDEHKAEAGIVLAGGVKMNGKMVSAAEYRANAYEIDARIKSAAVRSALESGQMLQGLRLFSAFDKDFLASGVRAELLPLAVSSIQSYLADIGKQLQGCDAKIKQRQSGLELMSKTDKDATEKAIREETANVEANMKKEKDAGIGWVTPNPYSKATLDATINFGKQELTRIENSRKDNHPEGGKLYRDTYALIQSGAAAQAVGTAIQSAVVAKIPTKYIEILKTSARDKGLKL